MFHHLAKMEMYTNYLAGIGFKITFHCTDQEVRTTLIFAGSGRTPDQTAPGLQRKLSNTLTESLIASDFI